LDNLDLQLVGGELLGIAGGARKATLLSLIAAQDEPDAGAESVQAE
jgi:ABC-type polysaccharide/polyol phosphate transport system ATPase subunit